MCFCALLLPAHHEHCSVHPAVSRSAQPHYLNSIGGVNAIRLALTVRRIGRNFVRTALYDKEFNSSL